MAAAVHYVNTQFINVDALGNVVDKSNSSTTINKVRSTGTEHRVIPDVAIANSANYPTIKKYLELEAADGYVLNHISQNIIVTYKIT